MVGSQAALSQVRRPRPRWLLPQLAPHYRPRVRRCLARGGARAGLTAGRRSLQCVRPAGTRKARACYHPSRYCPNGSNGSVVCSSSGRAGRLPAFGSTLSCRRRWPRSRLEAVNGRTRTGRASESCQRVSHPYAICHLTRTSTLMAASRPAPENPKGAIVSNGSTGCQPAACGLRPGTACAVSGPTDRMRAAIN